MTEQNFPLCEEAISIIVTYHDVKHTKHLTLYNLSITNII